MTVGEFLQREARIGDIVIFRDGGWQIGMTRIDNDSLYTHGLNPVLLNLYDVICYTYERRDWATKDALVLDIRKSEADARC